MEIKPQNDLSNKKQNKNIESTKYFSILPDLATGWRPKVLKIHPPILIKYKENFINNLINNLHSKTIGSNTNVIDMNFTNKYSHNIDNNNIGINSSNNNFNGKIIYLGPRHYNSFNFHNKVKHDYHVRFTVKNQDLPENFQQDMQKYTKAENRPFQGMNPNLKLTNQNQYNNGNIKIIFDSNFQSANLDLVVEVGKNEFDLFLRPDTNTCGHTQWFYFKVHIKSSFPKTQYSSQNSFIKQTIKFNICNNRKFKTLYGKGMKPYIFSHRLKEEKQIGWHQNGNNVSYKKYQNRYVFNNNEGLCDRNLEEGKVDNINRNVNYNGNGNENRNNVEVNNNNLAFNNTIGAYSQPQVIKSQINPQQNYVCLSFEYELQYAQDCIQFAYCPPYTYSQLKKDLSKLKKKASQQQNLEVTQERLCISLSGLEVPLLTITNSNGINKDHHNINVTENGSYQGCSKEDSSDININNHKDKKIFFATARIHPGESNGSYVMNGFLNYLVSPQANQLRNKCIFKIVPMLNPDGVILGNFRCGLAGKDLNRQFKVKNLQLLPEISSLKDYITKLKNEKNTSSSLMYYLDLHGHSTKKNSFMYGPEYDMWDNKFQKSKILPKLISFKTPMFKLHSCIYKIANYKKSTARAFMLGYVPFCYTIESSIGIYVDQKGQNVKFTTQKWEELGKKVGEAVSIAMERLFEEGSKTMIKKNKSKKNLVLKQIDVINLSNDGANNSASKSIGSTDALPLPQRNTLRVKNGILTQSCALKQKEIVSQQNININLNNPTNNLITTSSLKHSFSTIIPQPHYQLKKYLQPIKHFRLKQKQISLDFPQINEENRESDGQSDGKSDCESETNDFNKRQYEQISKDILKVIKQFEKVVGLNKLANLKDNSIKKISLCKNKQVFHSKIRKDSSLSQHKNLGVKGGHKVGNLQEMKLVPSLKYKLTKLQDGIYLTNIEKLEKNKRNYSEKKISGGLTYNFERSFVAGRAV